MAISKWLAKDRAALADAVALLYTENFMVRIASAMGAPLDSLVNSMPAVVGQGITAVAHKALEAAVAVAAQTTRSGERTASWDRLHLLGTAVTGAVGGFFGTPGALAEVPITTTVIFRSILDIARSEGADISQTEIRSECLNVFALGGPSASDDTADTAYLQTRALLADATKQAAGYLAKGIGKKQLASITNHLAKYLSVIAGRYGIIVGQKIAAQAVPIIGAAAGALINIAFTDYFQDIARGHFIWLRLEKKYGAERVAAAAQKIRDDKAKPKSKAAPAKRLPKPGPRRGG